MKFKKQSFWLFCIVLPLLTLNLEAREMPHIYLGDTHIQDIVLTQLDAATTAKFDPVFSYSSKHAAVKNVSFVVTNNSARSVIGLAFVYKLVDAEGNTTPYNLKTHAYLSSNVSPLIRSGEQMLISPNSFIAGSLVRPGHGIAGTVPPENLITQFNSAEKIYINLDAVIFEDGEVVGPNSLQLAQAMQRLKAAAEIVQKEVDTARLNGEDPSIRLNNLITTTGVARRETNKEVTSLSGQLLMTKHFEFSYEHIRKIQAQPSLYRKDGGSL